MKKTKALLVRMTPAQKEALRHYAARVGMPMGTWIREALLSVMGREDLRECEGNCFLEE